MTLRDIKTGRRPFFTNSVSSPSGHRSDAASNVTETTALPEEEGSEAVKESESRSCDVDAPMEGNNHRSSENEQLLEMTHRSISSVYTVRAASMAMRATTSISDDGNDVAQISESGDSNDAYPRGSGNGNVLTENEQLLEMDRRSCGQRHV